MVFSESKTIDVHCLGSNVSFPSSQPCLFSDVCAEKNNISCRNDFFLFSNMTCRAHRRTKI